MQIIFALMQLAKQKRWWLTPLILILFIALLHTIAVYTNWVEKFYSTHIYGCISSLLRILTGWIPFSVGDVLYGLAAIWVLYKMIKFFRGRITWQKFFLSLRDLIVKILWVYVYFLLSWGLNYYRYGIGYQLNLDPKSYTADDLKKVTSILVTNLNATRKELDSSHFTYPDNKTIFDDATVLYDSVQHIYPFLSYNHHSIKQMISSTIGNYSGFLGYYNPFTGEAQVNTVVPKFVIPFTTCHEMAHQLGYASESEASFVGFLAVRNSNATMFKYSCYFDLFVFANSELYVRDSAAAKQNRMALDTAVKKDMSEYRKYLLSYKNPIEPLLTKLYGNYLKVHNQPKGIDSYDEVVAWVVAYYKKFGTL